MQQILRSVINVTQKCQNEHENVHNVEVSNQVRYKVAAIIIGLIVLWTMITSSFEDSTPVITETYTPPAPVQQSSFELGKYKVESEEFAYINPKEINLWKSYGDRTKVGTASQGSVVEVVEHDPKNDYCKIKTDKSTGWVACGWLIK